eukprot:COSAG03_NODE_3182_length_2158_cov_17.981391_4_plen_210_part_00
METWAQTRFEPTVWIRSNEGYGNQSVWQSDRPAAGIDYYFMGGGSIANSIGLYRTATGAAPMPPRAIFGFMHSKDRFTDQSSLTAAAKGFRDGQFPIDTIVQDWFFWPKLQNSYVNHGFDPQRYPDPAAMTKQLHEWNMHFMVTYWPVCRLHTVVLKSFRVLDCIYITPIFTHPVAQCCGLSCGGKGSRWSVKAGACECHTTSSARQHV